MAKKECKEWPACALRLRECEFFSVVQMLREGGSFSDSQDEEAGVLRVLSHSSFGSSISSVMVSGC